MVHRNPKHPKAFWTILPQICSKPPREENSLAFMLFSISNQASFLAFPAKIAPSRDISQR